MEREPAEQIMDNLESNRPWHERIPARLGIEDGTAAGASHYQVGDKQPIEIMQEIMTPEEFQGFCRGNVIKYSLRLGHKDAAVKEAAKIEQYSKWLRMSLEGKTIKPMED